MCFLGYAKDTGLKDAMDVSADANGFLRTFPLQSLLAAHCPGDVASALPAIFSHFQQKLKLSPVCVCVCMSVFVPVSCVCISLSVSLSCVCV